MAMRVKITRDVHWHGKHLEIGTIVEVSQDEGAWLISRDKAQAAGAEEIKKEDRSIGLTTSNADGLVKRGKFAK